MSVLEGVLLQSSMLQFIQVSILVQTCTYINQWNRCKHHFYNNYEEEEGIAKQRNRRLRIQDESFCAIYIRITLNGAVILLMLARYISCTLGCYVNCCDNSTAQSATYLPIDSLPG